MTAIRVAVFLTLMVLSTAGVGLTQTADAPARAAAAAVQLKDVTVEQTPAGVVVTLATAGVPKYSATVIDVPVRIVIDLGATYSSPRTRWTALPQPIKEIRGSQFKPGTARVVLELERKTAYRIEESPKGLLLKLDGAATPASPEPPKRVAAAAADLPRMPQVPALADAPKLPDPAKKTAPPAVAVSKPQSAVASAARPASAPKPVAAPAIAASVLPASTPAVAAVDGPRARTAQAQPPVPPAPPSLPAAPAAAPPASNGSKLITLEFKDADVVNLLRILSAENGRNIVVGDDVKGKISVSLHNVTWQQALDTILEVKGLHKIEREGVIRIVSADQLAKEREALARAEEAKRKAEIEVRTKLAEAELKEQQLRDRRLALEAAVNEAQARGPLKEEVLRLSYADPGEIAHTLQGILGLVSGGEEIKPCRTIREDSSGRNIEFRSGGSVVSGPIAEPPFSQLFGPPRTPEQERVPPPVSIGQDVLVKGLAITAHCPTNTLFLRLYAADLERIKKLIREALDVPLPQVKIEARMEILDRTALESIGIQWGGAGAANVGKATVVGQGFQSSLQPPGTGVSNFSPANPNLNLGGLLPIFPDTGLPFGGNLVNLPISALPQSANVLPAGGIAFGIIGTNWNVNLALQALATQGKTRTLARPEIVTVENNRATMSLGEEIPYATVSSAGTQIQFKEALLKLEVIPTVLTEREPDGRTVTKIKMIVVVENNSRGDVVNLGTSGSPPAINKRKADTQVLLREGERLVIGGVTQVTNQDTVRKVPYMGDIPVLGWLFKQKENFEAGRELVVFLTPSVLKGLSGQAMTAPGGR